MIQGHGQCSVLGRNEWQLAWPIIWNSLLLAFLIPLLWSSFRIVRLLRALGWEVRAALVQTQAITHFLTGLAALLRVCLVLLERHSVVDAEVGDDDIARTERMVFSLFFPTTCALYLSLLHYWQVNIDGLHDTMDPQSRGDPNSYQPMVAPWRLLGIVNSVLFLYVLELVHGLLLIFKPSAFVEMVFVFWGVCVAGLGALCSVFTARRLHALVRELAPYSATDSLFKKLLVGPSLLALLACGALVLTVVESLYAQYYAWPHLIFWTIGRGLEAAALTIALITLGDMRPPPPTTAASFSDNAVPQSPTTPTELMSMALAGIGGPLAVGDARTAMLGFSPRAA